MYFEKYYFILLLLGFFIGSLYGGYEIAINKKNIYKFKNLIIIFFYALFGMIMSMFIPLLIPCFCIGIISYHFVKVLMDLI